MTSLAADDNTLDFITSSGHLALFLPFFKGNFVLDLFMAKLTGSSCTFRLPHRFDIGIKYKPIKPQMKNYYFHTQNMEQRLLSGSWWRYFLPSLLSRSLERMYVDQNRPFLDEPFPYWVESTENAGDASKKR